MVGRENLGKLGSLETSTPNRWENRKVAAEQDRPQRARRGRPPKTRRPVKMSADRTRALKLRRFELKLSEMDFERIDRLLGLTGAASMGEVVRDAVREYEAKILSGKKRGD